MWGPAPCTCPLWDGQVFSDERLKPPLHEGCTCYVTIEGQPPKDA